MPRDQTSSDAAKQGWWSPSCALSVGVRITAAPSGGVARTAGQGLAGPPETGGLIPLARAGATRDQGGDSAFFGISAVFVWG